MTDLEYELGKALVGLSDKHLKRSLYASPLHSAKRENYIDFSSNDYLGLSQDPSLRKTSGEWLYRYGTGFGSSRLVGGTIQECLHIEENLAQFHGRESALVFASGWQCNVSVLSSLLGFMQIVDKSEPMVFTDKLNHASLHYGCVSAGVRQTRFRHNDMNHLETLLLASRHKPGRRFIITESVFSMDGDRVDMSSLLELANRFDAYIYLDEAHSCGVYGPQGRGFFYEVLPVAGITMGTFSKAYGSFGAYISAPLNICEWLINKCSGFVHTTALPPAIWGSISAALKKMPFLEQERAKLLEKAAYVRHAFSTMGLNIGNSTTHIIPVIFSSAEQALLVADMLKNRYGIYAIAIRPPTVPAGKSRIRFTVCAFHQWEDIYALCHAMQDIVLEISSLNGDDK